MVIRFLSLFLLLPLWIFSGEFTASVNRTQVRLGESLLLSLTLKNATAKEAPQVHDLKKVFAINSQQHTSNTLVINGQASTSIVWKLVLIPQNEGDVTIPPVTVATSEGVLSTQPIAIKVIKKALSDDPAAVEEHGIQLKTEVSNPRPYKNEPLIYTIKLFTRQNIANIKINKIQVEDAIFEPHGEPRIREELLDGVKHGVVEFNYLVTPLKAGPLKIPSAIVQGVIPMKRKPCFGSFFDEDPFAMMGVFEQLQPFVLTTNEMTLEIQSAVSDIHPWLPAKSLRIEEKWENSEVLTVGEPFNRKFLMIAEGLLSNQLPSLHPFLSHDPLFKAYADKPEFKDEIKEGQIQSSREEQYTLIPQQAGVWTFPELAISWWDTDNHEKKVAIIPSKTVEVMPAPEVLRSEPIALGPPVTHSYSEPLVQESLGGLFYLIVGILVALLLGVISWGMMLKRKIANLTKDQTLAQPLAQQNEVMQKQEGKSECELPEKKERSKKEKLPDLNPT